MEQLRLVVQTKRRLMGKPAKPTMSEMMDATIRNDRDYIRENIDPDVRAVYDAVLEMYQLEEDCYARDERLAELRDGDGSYEPDPPIGRVR